MSNTTNNQPQPLMNAAAAAAAAPAQPPPAGNASLYVGDLDDEVTEAMIFEKFSTVGQILSIRVCRDMISRKSLGYAYVNFANATDAEKAIDTLNFDTIKNRQMRIMWSQRDPSLRKSGVGNLFIKNLDKSVNTRELYDTFSLFGEILSCKIATDDKGVSKGYGFIHFSSKDSAAKAIDKLNEKMINGKKIYVADFLPRSLRTNATSSEPSFNNLFIKNFGDEMDNDKLRAMFQPYGEITSIKVEMHAKENKDDKEGKDSNSAPKSKGFGFVCFKDPKNAQDAVTAMNGYEYNGKQLFVGRAMKKTERVEFLRSQFERKKADKSTKYAVGVNLYVKNLEDNIDDEQLKKEFEHFGNITSVRVMRDSTGRSKGFGFVCFGYPDEATKAVTEMNGKLVGGKPLYVALAQRKEERRLHLANQYMQRQFAMRSTINPNAQPMMNQQAAMNMNMFMNFPNAAAGLFAQPFPGGRPMFPNAGPGAMYQRPQLQPQARWSAPQPMRQPQPMQAGGPVYPNQMIRGMGMPQQRMAPVQQQQQPSMMANVPNMSAGKGSPNIRPQQHPAPVQYTGNVRNLQQMPGNANMQRAPIMAGAVNASAPEPDMVVTENGVTGKPNPTSDFMRLMQISSAADQKQLLGEKVYEFVRSWGHGENAGKLTGMLLEMESRELLSMVVAAMENPTGDNSLKEQVRKAHEVLLKSSAAGKGAASDEAATGENQN